MARTLDKKVIQNRIKANKLVMKDCKKQVTDALNAGIKGQEINGPVVRKALSQFITCTQKIANDGEKLASLEA